MKLPGRAGLRLAARGRARIAERAATDAALAEPAFAPERIREAVEEMVADAAEVWARPSQDRGRRDSGTNGRPDARLILGWAQRHEGWIGAGLRPLGKPTVDILAVANRTGEAEDRVVVRMRLSIRRNTRSGTMPGDFTILAERKARLEYAFTRSAG